METATVVHAQTREQLPLWQRYDPNGSAKAELRDAAAGENKTRPIHRWIPWIAGFSASFAEDAIESFLPRRNRAHALVVDPFAGVATTLVEALRAGCPAVGYEINAFACLAGSAKVKCVDVPPEAFKSEIDAFRTAMLRFEACVDNNLQRENHEALDKLLEDLALSAPPAFKSRIPFFSPAVQAKFLYALKRSSVLIEPDRSLFKAALGATMVSYSNYTYEPSLGSRPGAGKPTIDNASVGFTVCKKLDEMLKDLGWAQDNYGPVWRSLRREVRHLSFFDNDLPDDSISLLVTSPPYMNNYHYVRNTRPQLHWLELLGPGKQLSDLEHASFGKFWQTVRQGSQIDLAFDFPELRRAIEDLRGRNTEKGHYGGSGWANYVATYFNDTDRFLDLLARQLRPGAYAVIVVGNSIIQGAEFKVDHLLAQMAERKGLHVDNIYTVRTKRVGNSIIDSTVRNGGSDGHKHQTQLYDAAVVLRA